MKNEFDPTARGSFYTIGPDRPRAYMIMLHGSGRNALWLKEKADSLASMTPSCQVIAPNGYVDNYDESVVDYRKAAAPGEKFDWQFFSEAQCQRYKDHINEDNPFPAIKQHTIVGTPIHLFGFSAGAFGALKEYAFNHHDYNSITMEGYHLHSWLVDQLIATSKEDPSILRKPICVIMGRLDPVYLFNRHSGISKFIREISIAERLTHFAGRRKQQQEHEENILRLKEAGFTVQEHFPTFTHHNISASVVSTLRDFMSEQCTDKSTPYPQNT